MSFKDLLTPQPQPEAQKQVENFIYTEEQLMARLKFFIGVCLSLTLTGIVFVVLYSLIFVIAIKGMSSYLILLSRSSSMWKTISPFFRRHTDALCPVFTAASQISFTLRIPN